MKQTLATLLLILLPLGASAEDEEVRALWVTRYDYVSEEDVRGIVAGAAELGANRILFQVRGNGSVFYPSDIEPWSQRIGDDPGYDPLAVALREAAPRGLAVEAWINVLPLWKGTDLPEDENHPYLAHPEWVVVGSDGRPQRRSSHYVCANPARADVREHVAAIAAEIAARYAVDAVHLDYIRYVIDLERELDFSHDEESLRQFGRDPREAPQAWRRFKVDQVNATVRGIREAVRSARADCRLTAAVFATRDGRAKVHQDVERWVDEGWIDALYPMAYSNDDEEFARRMRESLPLGKSARGSIPVLIGIGAWRQQPAQTIRQIEATRAAGARGFALFCYAAFFTSADRDQLVEKDAGLRSRRVAALRALR